MNNYDTLGEARGLNTGKSRYEWDLHKKSQILHEYMTSCSDYITLAYFMN